MADDKRPVYAVAPESVKSWTQPRILYLTLYNLLFAALWASVGIDTIRHVPRGKFILFEAIEPRVRWIQTFTLIEVVHAAIRMQARVVWFGTH